MALAGCPRRPGSRSPPRAPRTGAAPAAGAYTSRNTGPKSAWMVSDEWRTWSPMRSNAPFCVPITSSGSSSASAPRRVPMAVGDGPRLPPPAAPASRAPRHAPRDGRAAAGLRAPCRSYVRAGRLECPSPRPWGRGRNLAWVRPWWRVPLHGARNRVALNGWQSRALVTEPLSSSAYREARPIAQGHSTHTCPIHDPFTTHNGHLDPFSLAGIPGGLLWWLLSRPLGRRIARGALRVGRCAWGVARGALRVGRCAWGSDGRPRRRGQCAKTWSRCRWPGAWSAPASNGSRCPATGAPYWAASTSAKRAWARRTWASGWWPPSRLMSVCSVWWIAPALADGPRGAARLCLGTLRGS